MIDRQAELDARICGMMDGWRDRPQEYQAKWPAVPKRKEWRKSELFDLPEITLAMRKMLEPEPPKPDRKYRISYSNGTNGPWDPEASLPYLINWCEFSTSAWVEILENGEVSRLDPTAARSGGRP